MSLMGNNNKHTFEGNFLVGKCRFSIIVGAFLTVEFIFDKLHGS